MNVQFEGHDQQAKRIKQFLFDDDSLHTNELAAIVDAKSKVRLVQPESIDGEHKVPLDKSGKE